MSLRSTRAQRAHVRQLGLTVELQASELIHVESSYKYSPEEIEMLAERAGLRLDDRWFDAERRFCSVLLSPA
jgi:L-histidine N-alpha-methyltransferase